VNTALKATGNTSKLKKIHPVIVDGLIPLNFGN